MLNLAHYKDNAADFITNVIKSKKSSPKDPTYKTRVEALAGDLASHATTYDTSFNDNQLQLLTPVGYTGGNKGDILALYSYHSAIMQKLKLGITTVAVNRIISTCQNCTISEINSFDHSVPQKEFPEFVVHPKNLFPSCTRCNGHKSKIWRASGKRVFLNLYLDQLPDLQYLFPSVTVTPPDIEVSFSVSNPHGIDAQLFEKIDYHYAKLQLCDRFTENIDKVITPLKHSISSSLKYLTIEEARDVAIDTAMKNRNAFGYNYWKSMTELELLKSDEFLKMC